MSTFQFTVQSMETFIAALKTLNLSSSRSRSSSPTVTLQAEIIRNDPVVAGLFMTSVAENTITTVLLPATPMSPVAGGQGRPVGSYGGSVFSQIAAPSSSMLLSYAAVANTGAAPPLRSPDAHTGAFVVADYAAPVTVRVADLLAICNSQRNIARAIDEAASAAGRLDGLLARKAVRPGQRTLSRPAVLRAMAGANEDGYMQLKMAFIAVPQHVPRTPAVGVPGGPSSDALLTQPTEPTEEPLLFSAHLNAGQQDNETPPAPLTPANIDETPDLADAPLLVLRLIGDGPFRLASAAASAERLVGADTSRTAVSTPARVTLSMAVVPAGDGERHLASAAGVEVTFAAATDTAAPVRVTAQFRAPAHVHGRAAAALLDTGGRSVLDGSEADGREAFVDIEAVPTRSVFSFEYLPAQLAAFRTFSAAAAVTLRLGPAGDLQLGGDIPTTHGSMLVQTVLQASEDI